MWIVNSYERTGLVFTKILHFNLISDFKLDSMFINNDTENKKSNSDVSTKYVVSLAYFKGINNVTSVKEQ